MKKKEPQMLQLNESNNLFVDVEVVQRIIISLYRITTEGKKYPPHPLSMHSMLQFLHANPIVLLLIKLMLHVLAQFMTLIQQFPS